MNKIFPHLRLITKRLNKQKLKHRKSINMLKILFNTVKILRSKVIPLMDERTQDIKTRKMYSLMIQMRKKMKMTSIKKIMIKNQVNKAVSLNPNQNMKTFLTWWQRVFPSRTSHLKWSKTCSGTKQTVNTVNTYRK